MSISDALVGHLMTIYLGMIAVMKVYGLVTGRSFTGVFVLAVSTAVAGVALIAALTWDVSRKVTYAFTREQVREMCRGGICWHGVAVKSPASQVTTMSYKFLKISDTYDIREVEEYTPYSEPRMSRDMWRDEVLSCHDEQTECCGVLYKICNEYKAERDVADRKLVGEEMENRRLQDVIKALEEKVTNMDMQNQQLVTEKEALISNSLADMRNFVIMLLFGILIGVLFRF